jgi:TonB family protein
MSRLQKKCLIASAGLHGLLLLILVFGAALMPEDKASSLTRITFFDASKITDGPSHGGEAQANATQPPLAPVAPPQPPVSAPAQPPLAVPQSTPKLAPTPRSDDESFKPVKPKTAQTDEFTPVDHPPVKQTASNNNAADAKARAMADNQRRIANQINRGINHLSSALGKDTAVQMSSGADGGEAAANYGDIVQSIYDAAWNQPASVDDSAVVVVSITIERDGRVSRHEIVKPSGNTAMDRSIENTLDNVSVIAPFPEGSKDAERTYNIKFSLTAK